MIDVNQLRNGTAFEEDGVPYLVIKYEFTKMGRGNATIKVRARNLKTGNVLVKSYTSGHSVEKISLQKKPMQFLYADENNCVFMDKESFEQVEIDEELVGEQKKYLVDGLEVAVLFWEDQALSLELPKKMEFMVKDTEPGNKGNSVSNMYKPATLENGLEIKVPLFIKPNEKVIVNTDTGEYVARA